MKTFMIILLVIVAVFLVWYIVSFKGVNKETVEIIIDKTKNITMTVERYCVSKVL